MCVIKDVCWVRFHKHINISITLFIITTTSLVIKKPRLEEEGVGFQCCTNYCIKLRLEEKRMEDFHFKLKGSVKPASSTSMSPI